MRAAGIARDGRSRAEIVGVARITGGEIVIAATREARAILTKADEVNFLSGPGRGVILIKLTSKDDRVLGFVASSRRSRSTDRRDQPRRRTDDHHSEVRDHRPRRQRPRTAAARPVHARRLARAGHAGRAHLERGIINLMDVAQQYLADVIQKFEKLKIYGDRAIAQVSDDELFRVADQESEQHRDRDAAHRRQPAVALH